MDSQPIDQQGDLSDSDTFEEAIDDPDTRCPRCYICMSELHELASLDPPVRWFQNQVCRCVGEPGTICEPCFRMEATLRQGCAMCGEPWNDDILASFGINYFEDAIDNPQIRFPRCFRCRTELQELDNMGTPWYHIQICDCRGRKFCEPCLKEYLLFFPEGCRRCRMPWRPGVFEYIYGTVPMSYERFRRELNDILKGIQFYYSTFFCFTIAWKFLWPWYHFKIRQRAGGVVGQYVLPSLIVVLMLMFVLTATNLLFGFLSMMVRRYSHTLYRWFGRYLTHTERMDVNILVAPGRR